MPDPKYYIDENHEYVRAYARKKRQRRLSGSALLMLLLLAIATVWFLFQVWPAVVVVAAICLLVYVLRHRKQWQHWFLMRKVRKLEEQQRRELEDNRAKARITELQQGRLER